MGRGGLLGVRPGRVNSYPCLFLPLGFLDVTGGALVLCYLPPQADSFWEPGDPGLNPLKLGAKLNLSSFRFQVSGIFVPVIGNELYLCIFCIILTLFITSLGMPPQTL